MSKKRAVPSDRHTRFAAGTPTDEDIRHIAGKIEQLLPPEVLALAGQFGLNIEHTIRFTLLSQACRTAREMLGWSTKQAAVNVGVPLSRIKAIEAPERGMTQKEIKLYVKILGVESWFLAWLEANRSAFDALEREPAGKMPWAAKIRKMEL